ncbi:DEAD/DEAH box helicase family protein [Oceanobacillus sp. GSFE11]|uniref:DEAD/DEAH box helicase family protein n=2 Tax=Oceanobacillus jordanicus TaxID=2867266 RepID=A0AAW5B847_9BACI|nr:DEAD/DEAH box helicase family protein [Oceanobacillus jordanicus]
MVVPLNRQELMDLAKNVTGKLLLRQEIPLSAFHFTQAVEQKFIRAVPSFTKKHFTLQCNRCGNNEKRLMAQYPCSICNKTHSYCRKCIAMGRVSECTMLYEWSGPVPEWKIHADPCTWKGTLTEAQQKAADRIASAVVNKEKELLSWAVCGAGKTEMLFPAITIALKQGKRICLATPRADVVRELQPRIQQAFSDVTVQALYGGSKDKKGTAQLILATTHQLLRFKQAFDVMIIDEIDAFPFHAEPSLSFAAERAIKLDSTTIYLTATPRKQQLKRIRNNLLPHIFVPRRFHSYPLPVPQMKQVSQLKSQLKKKELPPSFLKWLLIRKHPQRQILVFVPTVSLADHLSVPLTDLLISYDIITSKQQASTVHASDGDREEKVQSFRDRDLFMLLTTTILERGVTFPSVDVIILDAGHHVFDQAAIVQIAGRAGRSTDDPFGDVLLFHDGKTEAMVEAVESIRKMNKRGGFA